MSVQTTLLVLSALTLSACAPGAATSSTEVPSRAVPAVAEKSQAKYALDILTPEGWDKDRDAYGLAILEHPDKTIWVSIDLYELGSNSIIQFLGEREVDVREDIESDGGTVIFSIALLDGFVSNTHAVAYAGNDPSGTLNGILLAKPVAGTRSVMIFRFQSQSESTEELTDFIVQIASGTTAQPIN